MWTWEWIVVCFAVFILAEAAVIVYLIHCKDWSLRQWFVDLGGAIRLPIGAGKAKETTVAQHEELLESSLVYRVKHMAATRASQSSISLEKDSNSDASISSYYGTPLKRSPKGKSIQLSSGSTSSQIEPSEPQQSEEKSEG